MAEGTGDAGHAHDVADRRAASAERTSCARRLVPLPETLRDPIVLREYHGMMYAEIADKLAVPLNTVRTRIFRSKAALRAALSDWEEQS